MRSANAWIRSNSAGSASSCSTTAIPRPPPPALALTIRGKPISRPAASAAAASRTGASVPGDTGTPAADTRLRALILSPICSITSAEGPTQTSPWSSTRRANSAFSARNP